MFVSDVPELLTEWDSARNQPLGLDPAKLKLHSNIKAWWRCRVGHEWQATIDKRAIGRKCPYCAKRLVLVGDNDLQTTHPTLAAEWDPSSNAPLKPNEVTAISIKRASWICSKCGHKWESSIRDRALYGRGCAKCATTRRARKRIETLIAARGSLAASNSNLLKEWNYGKNIISPEEITIKSNKKVWWLCPKCGYEWEAKVCNRSNGRGCPCCSHQVLVVGMNDLATTHPQLAKEWHPTKNGKLKPNDVMAGQSKKVWWLCPNGHSYEATLYHRSGKIGTRCSVCNNGRQTSFREQAFYYYLRQAFPDAVSRFKADWLGRFELDIFIPSQKLAIEYDGVAWHKEEASEREKAKYRLCRKQGVKLIRIKEKIPEEQHSADIADELLTIEDVEATGNFERLVRFVVDQLDPRSNPWTRRNPLQFNSPIDIDIERDRFNILKKMSCEVKDSLANRRPDLAKEWHPVKNGEFKPTMFTCGSDFRVWWICPTCGREYAASISHRVGGTGCAKCCRAKFASTYRRNQVLKKGCLSDKRLLREWNHEKNGNCRPEDFTSHSTVKVWWRCEKCGHEWKATICNRSNGRGCPCCSNKVAVKGKNDLATLHPNLVKEWDYDKNGLLTPDRIVPGHNGPV